MAYWSDESLAAPDDAMMAVDIEVQGGALSPGIPKSLFQVPGLYQSGLRRNGYDVSPDGQRFLVNIPLGGPAETPAIWIQNWTADLQP